LESVFVGSVFDFMGRCGEKTCNLYKTEPFDLALRTSGDDWPPVGFTMIGNARLKNIRACIESVVQEGVPSEFAELGVLRGGACIWARQLFDLAGERHRLVHVFDVFGPREEYGAVSPFILVSKERVIQNFRNFNANISSTQFHEGLSQHTLNDFSSRFKDMTLAVLRIDGNNYDFHQNALYYLYPKVSVGGFIVFDDVYTHPVTMQAPCLFVSHGSCVSHA
jgi:O-methyltransferase